MKTLNILVDITEEDLESFRNLVYHGNEKSFRWSFPAEEEDTMININFINPDYTQDEE